MKKMRLGHVCDETGKVSDKICIVMAGVMFDEKLLWLVGHLS
jgi:hypothetical protein